MIFFVLLAKSFFKNSCFLQTSTIFAMILIILNWLITITTIYTRWLKMVIKCTWLMQNNTAEFGSIELQICKIPIICTFALWSNIFLFGVLYGVVVWVFEYNKLDRILGMGKLTSSKTWFAIAWVLVGLWVPSWTKHGYMYPAMGMSTRPWVCVPLPSWFRHGYACTSISPWWVLVP